METSAEEMRPVAASSSNAKPPKLLADLPLELLTKILLECSGADKLKRVALVNRQFYCAVKDPAAWSNVDRFLLFGENTMGFTSSGKSLNLGLSAPHSAEKVQSVCRFVEGSLKNVKCIALYIANYPAQIKQLIPKLIVDWKCLQTVHILLMEVTHSDCRAYVDNVLLFYHKLMRQIAASPDLCEKLKLSICLYDGHRQFGCNPDLYEQCLPLALKCPIKELSLTIGIFGDYSKQDVEGMFKDVAIESLEFHGNKIHWDLNLFARYSPKLLAAINQLRPNTLKNFGENEGHIHYDYLQSECGITKFLSAINDSQLSAVSYFVVRGRQIEAPDPDSDSDDSEDEADVDEPMPAVHMRNSLNLLHTVKAVLHKMPKLCELVVHCEQADNDTFEWQLQPSMEIIEELMIRAKQQPNGFEAFFIDFPESPFESSALQTELDKIFKPELYKTQIKNKHDIQLTCLESKRTLKLFWY